MLMKFFSVTGALLSGIAAIAVSGVLIKR